MAVGADVKAARIDANTGRALLAAAEARVNPGDRFVIAGFGVGIFLVNTQLPTGFIPLEDQGMIYGILQTPPGSTIEYTNAKSHELQDIAKRIDGVNSVSSLAGYEVLTDRKSVV